MAGYQTQKEWEKRIATVIDYILTHLPEDIPLATLSEVAHYSPFHFQKLFKQLLGETPKQYLLKLRLERAVLLMVIHPHKSLQEISLDCHFSSPAVFSRSIRNYFGYSPEQLRLLPHSQRMKVLHARNPLAIPPGCSRQSPVTFSRSLLTESVRMRKIEPVKGIYLIAPSNNPEAIRSAFRKLIHMADAHGLLAESSHPYGIIHPHQRNLYQAFVSIDPGKTVPANCRLGWIKGGKYASFKVASELNQTNQLAHFFYEHWLPENGYKIAAITGFETFLEDPVATPYTELTRELFIPVEVEE